MGHALRELLMLLGLLLGGIFVSTWAGCAARPSGALAPPPPPPVVRPDASLVLAPAVECDLGILRITRAMRCADELHRRPAYGYAW